MNDKLYYVYRFLDKENITLYIGQSRQYSLETRVNQHRTSQSWFNEVEKVEFIYCMDRLEMDLFERFYISKFRPKYNISNSGYKIPRIKCYHEEWKELEEFKNITINKLIHEQTIINRLNNKINNTNVSKITGNKPINIIMECFVNSNNEAIQL